MNLLGRIPNFDEPIEALYICHENILKRMKRIESLSNDLLRNGPEMFARQQDDWRELLSFIHHSVAHHTRDEEEGLFPMLEDHAGDDLAHLRTDHRWANETEEWLQQQFDIFTGYQHTPSQIHMQQFAERAGELARFYSNHIAHENDEVFPIALQVLNDDQMHHLGMLMRKHRKIEENATMEGEEA